MSLRDFPFILKTGRSRDYCRYGRKWAHCTIEFVLLGHKYLAFVRAGMMLATLLGSANIA
jgi:hypothetical protein